MAKIKLKKRKDVIPGGLADKKQPEDFDQEALKKGLKVELEHTTDSDIALEIAMDHLTEDPLYYDKLAKMEKGAVKEMKIKIKKKLLKEKLEEGAWARAAARARHHTYGYGTKPTTPTRGTTDPDAEERRREREMKADLNEPNDPNTSNVKKEANMAVGDVETAPTAPADFSGTPDFEGDMARSQMLKVNEYSAELMDMITPEMQLPAWVQAKLAKVADYMGAVKHFLEGEMKLGEELSGGQKKLDQDSDGDIDAKDLAALRKKKDLNEKKKDFPDLTGDGKVTKADILKGRGVIDEDSLEESYIFEASCDDGEMYEMELYSEECGCGALQETLEEAEYQGRKVTLNKPMRGDVKKFKVFVKDPSTGNVKKVNFGDPNMRIKKSNPKRRKSFRARHNCDNPGPKTKARYWSCRKWEE